jgi:hypothetical protein
VIDDMDMIQNRENEPTMPEICEYITGEARTLWQEFVTNVEEEFQTAPKFAFSVCAAKPGWNVKYKKSGKALCTLYPERDAFVALVVLGAKDMVLFEGVCGDYAPSINQQYKKTATFNGTKWMMIQIKDRETANDVLKLIRLKRAAARMKP